MPLFDLALPYDRGPGEVDEMFARARAADEGGARALWVSDDWYGLDAFAALAAVGQHCRGPKLGVGVTNPFSRHLVEIAAGALTADRFAGGGRVIVTLGRSAKWGAEALGLHFGSGQRALRDGVRILKRLLRGEEVTEKTEHFTLTNHRMTWPLPETPIPVYLAAIGPKTLQLAGELADGALLLGFCTPAYCRFAAEQVRIGADRVGRDPAEVDLVCPQVLFPGELPPPMADAMIPMLAVMSLLPGVGEALSVDSDLAPDWAETLRREVDAEALFKSGRDVFPEFVKQGGVEKARRHISHAFMADTGLFGSEEAIAARIATLVETGMTHLSLTPAGLSAADTLKQARACARAAGLDPDA